MQDTRERIFNYEMGYTEAEFATVLQGNFTGHESGLHCQSDGNNQWLITDKSSALRVNVNIRQRTARQLGAMSLPVLAVNFDFTSPPEQAIEAFFDRFFKYFHKGGG